jgi:23S rRNA pseudouridine1911/1915/1917 synthase
MSVRDQFIRVEASRPSERLDTYLRSLYPMMSRGALQRLMAEGHLTVNGEPVKPTHHPQEGDEIHLVWPEPQPAEPRPEAMSLAVLYEDSDLLVLNKAPGVVVHPAAGCDEGTLVNGLLHHCVGQLSGIGGVARPGIVHRLDRDTSGCMVVAKNDEAHIGLSRQFAARTTGKTYLAIVCGRLDPAAGEIRAAIARHPTHRKRMAVSDGKGRAAWTSYRVTQYLRGSTLVEATLHTGRTHQIRVHFQHIGFPLVGDAVYGKSQNKRLTEVARYTTARQMLHAWKLAFEHPRSGARLEFEAPVPEDFRAALEALSLEKAEG